MTNLKAVNVGMNKFCGPAVLSILTGKSTDECARVISKINGHYVIQGVQLNDLLKAADKLGYDYHPAIAGNSLYGTIIRLAHEDGMYIVTIPNHFIVIEVVDRKAFFCDNHTKEPIPASSSARLGQSVVAAHKVYRREAPLEPPKPNLISTTFNVLVLSHGIFIDRVLHYDNDSTREEHIGTIRVNNEVELNAVISKLRSLDEVHE